MDKLTVKNDVSSNMALSRREQNLRITGVILNGSSANSLGI